MFPPVYLKQGSRPAAIPADYKTLGCVSKDSTLQQQVVDWLLTNDTRSTMSAQTYICMTLPQTV